MNKNKLRKFPIKCVQCGRNVLFVLPNNSKQPKLCKKCMSVKHFKQMGIKMDNEVLK